MTAVDSLQHPPTSAWCPVARARDEVGQEGAADPAPMPFRVDVERELGRVPVRGSRAEDFERSPADDRTGGLSDDDRVGQGAALEPRKPLLERHRFGEESCRGTRDIMVLDVVDGLGIVARRRAD